MIRAIDVYRAAKATYDCYGDERYAESKATNFLRRCGGTIEETLPDDDGTGATGPDMEISMKNVKAVVYAALDSDSEKVFWNMMCNYGVKC